MPYCYFARVRGSVLLLRLFSHDANLERRNPLMSRSLNLALTRLPGLARSDVVHGLDRTNIPERLSPLFRKKLLPVIPVFCDPASPSTEVNVGHLTNVFS